MTGKTKGEKKMKSGVRSPTAHRTLEQARKHADTYGQTEKYKRDHASRMRARRAAQKKGMVKKGDGKDVHHKDNNPRNNSAKNLAVASRKTNRGHGKSPGGRGGRKRQA